MIELRKETNAKYKLKVGRSKTGLGLYAMEPIPKGKRIIEYVGKVMTGEPDDATNGLYIFNINKKIDIDGAPRWNTARYINHSCRPNAETDTLKDHVWVKSSRNIMLGEEITYDYGKEYWNEYIKPKGCRCPKCTEKRAASEGVKKASTKKEAKKSTKKTAKKK
jgi:SET domain-containing protein